MGDFFEEKRPQLVEPLTLEGLRVIAEKQDLEPRESYEASLDRALEALRDTEGIVELKNQKIPVIVVSDLHGRREFLMRLLERPTETEETVFERLQKRTINVVCLGDGMHTERKDNWVMPNDPTFAEKMRTEMTRSLGTMKMVMELKAAFPDNFHYVRGNHDDMEEEFPPYMKYLGTRGDRRDKGESTVVKEWMGQHFPGLSQRFGQLDRSWPLIVKGERIVMSHTPSAVPLDIEQVKKRNRAMTEALTFTDNTVAGWEERSGNIVQDNLEKIGGKQAIWVTGHRTVGGLGRIQLNGSLIQICSPKLELILRWDNEELYMIMDMIRSELVRMKPPPPREFSKEERLKRLLGRVDIGLLRKIGRGVVLALGVGALGIGVKEIMEKAREHPSPKPPSVTSRVESAPAAVVATEEEIMKRVGLYKDKDGLLRKKGQPGHFMINKAEGFVLYRHPDGRSWALPADADPINGWIKTRGTTRIEKLQLQSVLQGGKYKWRQTGQPGYFQVYDNGEVKYFHTDGTVYTLPADERDIVNGWKKEEEK